MRALLEELSQLAKSDRQRRMLEDLLSDEGLHPSRYNYSAARTRKFGEEGWKTFEGLRARLETALGTTEWALAELNLGSEKGRHFAIRHRSELQPHQISDPLVRNLQEKGLDRDQIDGVLSGVLTPGNASPLLRPLPEDLVPEVDRDDDLEMGRITR